MADAQDPDQDQPDLSGRTRTYTWQDPVSGRGDTAGQTGLEYVQAMVSGEIAPTPAGYTLDYRITACSPGTVEITTTPQEWMFNSNNGVQGGVIAALFDSAVATAVMTELPAGKAVTTLDLTTRYIRAIAAHSGTITITAIADHVGRTTGTARAEARDGHGRLCATASTTVLILDRG